MTTAKELLDAATPLPWRLYVTKGDPDDSDWFITRDDPAPFIHEMADYKSKEVATGWTSPVTNAALIVYAVNRLPDYEAAVDLLRRGAERWHGLSEDPIHMSNIFRECPDEFCTEARVALARLRDEVPV